MRAVLGIVGGSGLYDLPGLGAGEWRRVESPWGRPSDDILFAELDGLPLRFLPRHGRGHRLGPSQIDSRANIDALKRAGVTDLVSVSACGSLQEGLGPGSFVLVDQFVDRTLGRDRSFFGEGLVAHVSMADPVSPGLAARIAEAGEAEGIDVTRGATYVAIEGPQFSSRAESRLFQSWGCDVIGMTNMPEAKLAREAEICYATVAMITDFDCWHPDHDAVTVNQIVKVLLENADKARTLVRHLAPRIAADRQASACVCRHALQHALITAPESRDPAVLARLDAVAGRFLG